MWYNLVVDDDDVVVVIILATIVCSCAALVRGETFFFDRGTRCTHTATRTLCRAKPGIAKSECVLSLSICQQT